MASQDSTLLDSLWQQEMLAGTLSNAPQLGSLSGRVFIDQNADGVYESNETPLSGVSVQMRDALGTLLDSMLTDNAGLFHFDALLPGGYQLQELQPNGYQDGLAIIGTAGGHTLGSNQIVDIALMSGVSGQHYHFTERPQAPTSGNNSAASGSTTTSDTIGVNNLSPFYFGVAIDALSAGAVVSEIQVVAPPAENVASPSVSQTTASPTQLSTPPASLDLTSSTPTEPTPPVWQLSVINGGQPREDAVAVQLSRATNDTHWQMPDGEPMQWKLRTVEGDQVFEAKLAFGPAWGVPVTGDFNGDGVSDLAVVHEGQWFMDLNGNGRWDDADMWAHLGHRNARPLVGDWDGDGKTDIGVVGQSVALDTLQNADQARAATRPQPLNVSADQVAPRATHELRRTVNGSLRTATIDRIFKYGHSADMPVIGDWDSEGVDSIGVFRDGHWNLKVHADGRQESSAEVFEYGQFGDLPIVGDFNGDGTDEIGVFRDGRWFIDMNHDRVLDHHDLAFEYGEVGDRPVVGDWNGDGVDDIGVVSRAR